MKKTTHTTGKGLFVLLPLLSLISVSTHADPILLTQPTISPTSSSKTQSAKTRVPRLLTNLTLDYANATQNSVEVLNAKVSVTLPDASLIAALDALMNASDKTCRVECRQLQAQHLPLTVKDMPLGVMLDSLAKLSGGRLYVLPTKLILAPTTALTDEEKKKAKLFGVLLTSVTLPNTPEAKALLIRNAQGKTILDVANTKVGSSGGTYLASMLSGFISPGPVPPGTFEPKILGPVSKEELHNRLQIDFHDANYADVMASFAHSVGCELYLTPEHFIICAPDQFNAPENRQWTQNAVPAFTASSTNITFFDLSAKTS